MFFAILAFVCKSIDFEKNSVFPWENCKSQGFEGFQLDKNLQKDGQKNTKKHEDFQ